MFGRTTGKREVARFDYTKKPIRPCFLMGWAKALISFPDLKKRGLKATHPYSVNNVMTLEGFNTYTEPLMRSLGVLGTRKFITDMWKQR